MNFLTALPVDGRPVVRAQVQQLVALAGWQLRCPEVSALGHFRQPADRDALAAWLQRESVGAAGVIVSVDMLLYGGLVPSRFVPDTLPELLARLALLHELPQPLYAFAATMRISNNDVADEEKPYWATHGRALWAWSFHSDRCAVHGLPEDPALADAIPTEIRTDYLATRARNFAVNRALLGLVAEGVIQRLVLPQDDTAEFGFNIAERRALAAESAALGLSDRVLIYPGADEVLHTLCAHAVSRGQPPLRLALRCTDPGHVGDLRALYEDRPVLDSVASQVAAVGAVITDEAPDATLLVHTRGRSQGDWAMHKGLPEALPIAFELPAGPVAVADLAYANGGDPELLAHLPVAELAGYAGWNTASNSLGSLLAQLVLARGRWGELPNRLVTALRLAEDVAYQAELRQVLRDAVAEPSGTLEADYAAAVVPAVDAWLAERGLPGRVSRCYLPWGRSFEIGLELMA
jgi:hypothetical protein